MRKILTIAALLFSLPGFGQMQMLFSSDSLVGITSPLAIDSLFYWFAADQGVLDSLGGAIATDKGVGTWQDLSGHGYHVTQPADTDRPVYKPTGGPGSKPCIQFDGSDDFLASAPHFWGSDDITVVAVMKFANATRNVDEIIIGKYETAINKRQWFFGGLPSASSYQHRLATSSAGTAFSGEIRSTSAKSTSFSVWVSLLNGADKMWKDGTEETLTVNAATTIHDNADAPLGIGANNVLGTIGGPLQGSISEIIVYSRALSATERAAIENYLNKKYDLY